MECSECSYSGTDWAVDVTRSYEGELDATGTVVYDEDDFQQETIVKCPECGEWQDETSAEAH
jgi:hypothetical protein